MPFTALLLLCLMVAAANTPQPALAQSSQSASQAFVPTLGDLFFLVEPGHTPSEIKSLLLLQNAMDAQLRRLGATQVHHKTPTPGQQKKAQSQQAFGQKLLRTARNAQKNRRPSIARNTIARAISPLLNAMQSGARCGDALRRALWLQATLAQKPHKILKQLASQYPAPGHPWQPPKLLKTNPKLLEHYRRLQTKAVQSSQTYQITGNKSPAMLWIDGLAAGLLPHQAQLPKGEHTLVATDATGAFSVTQLKVRGSSTQSQSIALNPLRQEQSAVPRFLTEADALEPDLQTIFAVKTPSGLLPSHGFSLAAINSGFISQRVDQGGDLEHGIWSSVHTSPLVDWDSAWILASKMLEALVLAPKEGAGRRHAVLRHPSPAFLKAADKTPDSPKLGIHTQASDAPEVRQASLAANNLEHRPVV